MRRGTARVVVHGLALLSIGSPAFAVGPQLYETGPTRDVALLRFVNAGAQPLLVANAGGATLAVSPAAPIGEYQPMRADVPVSGEWRDGARHLAIALRLQPGALASLVAWRAVDGALRSANFVERTVPFDGLRASLAFYAVTSCASGAPAALVALTDQATQGEPATRAVAPRVVFEGLAQGSVARRAVNPVHLTVQARCEGRIIGAPLVLGQLQAGQRYSVFLIPAPGGGALLGGRDGIAH